MYPLAIVIGFVTIFVGDTSCDLINSRPINWSQVTTEERQYLFPAFLEVASSQCDLTEDACDIGCCSDKDCSEEQKQSFDCLGGVADGEKSAVLPSWNGERQSPVGDRFWSPFLCFVAANTPFLGNFFRTPKKIDSISKLNIDTNEAFKSGSRLRSATNGTEPKSYRLGTPIRSWLVAESGVPGVGFLRLPRNLISDGVCSDGSRVKYLENRRARCSRKINRQVCEDGAGSPISAWNYVVSDTTSNSTPRRFPTVARDYLGQNVTNTRVELRCLTNGSEYLTISKSIFKVSDSKIKGSATVNCTFDSANIPPASYNAETETCENVVISVSYDFVWNNTQLLNMSAIYEFADVPVTTAALLRSSRYEIDARKARGKVKDRTHFYVSQSFAVTFRHVGTGKGNDSAKLRSGNPGYDVGRRLISWSRNSTNITDAVLEDAAFAIWINGDAGCRESSQIPFGHDVMAKCSLWVQDEEVEDCNGLRRRVQLLQDSLTTANVVASSGAFPAPWNISSAADLLVPILRPDDNATLEASNGSTSGACALPTSRSVLVLYTSVLDAFGRSIHRVVGVKTSLANETWPRISGLPMTSRERIRVVLTSAVTFVPVPVREEKPLSRFWEQVFAPDGSETAWLNMFHVLDDVTTGEEMTNVTMATISLVATALVLIAALTRC